MAERTGIEWADSTLNFWIGCTKVSEACDHCYAEEEWADRKSRVEWGPHGDRSPTRTWPQAHKWQRAAAANGGIDPALGRRRRVFVNSLSDTFDNHASIDAQAARARLWDTIRACPDVIFMLLTKRPQNIARMLPDDWGAGWPNVWLGTTVEHQRAAEQRVPHLLLVPAALHFLSCEPLLGPVDLTEIMHAPGHALHALWGLKAETDGTAQYGASIGWVICGGESGGGARPMLPDWARALLKQCRAADVPFFFKQWGCVVSLRPSMNGTATIEGATLVQKHCPKKQPPIRGAWMIETSRDYPQWFMTMRMNKHATGRMLDGEIYSEVPACAL